MRRHHRRAIEAAVETRMAEIAQHYETMKGTCGRLRYNSEGQVAGRVGGYKDTFPEMTGLRWNPADIARAIRLGRGKRYISIREAVRSVAIQAYQEHLSTIAQKAWRTRLQLLEWGATSHPSDAARKAWETRRKNNASQN